jgi:hypothetical protein
MAKATTTTTAAEWPKALDVMTSIAEKAIDFRYANRRVTMVDVGRAVLAASRIIHIKNLDERLETENRAVMQIAKKRQLVS